MNIYVHSDGSANALSQIGGWCAILTASDGDPNRLLSLARETDLSRSVGSIGVGRGEGFKIRILSGGAEGTTSQRMELTAILKGIQAMKPCAVTVVTDSQYAIGVLSGKWKPKRKDGETTNGDLINEFKEAAQGFKITWEHVKGHSGHPLNGLADEIARREYEKQTAAGTTSPAGG